MELVENKICWCSFIIIDLSELEILYAKKSLEYKCLQSTDSYRAITWPITVVKITYINSIVIMIKVWLKVLLCECNALLFSSSFPIFKFCRPLLKPTHSFVLLSYWVDSVIISASNLTTAMWESVPQLLSCHSFWRNMMKSFGVIWRSQLK